MALTVHPNLPVLASGSTERLFFSTLPSSLPYRFYRFIELTWMLLAILLTLPAQWSPSSLSVQYIITHLPPCHSRYHMLEGWSKSSPWMAKPFVNLSTMKVKRKVGCHPASFFFLFFLFFFAFRFSVCVRRALVEVNILPHFHPVVSPSRPGFSAHRFAPISCLTFHPHKYMLAVGSTDSTISVYGTREDFWSCFAMLVLWNVNNDVTEC